LKIPCEWIGVNTFFHKDGKPYYQIQDHNIKYFVFNIFTHVLQANPTSWASIDLPESVENHAEPRGICGHRACFQQARESRISATEETVGFAPQHLTPIDQARRGKSPLAGSGWGSLARLGQEP
jgi:hypothetical protein